MVSAASRFTHGIELCRVSLKQDHTRLARKDWQDVHMPDAPQGNPGWPFLAWAGSSPSLMTPVFVWSHEVLHVLRHPQVGGVWARAKSSQQGLRFASSRAWCLRVISVGGPGHGGVDEHGQVARQLALAHRVQLIATGHLLIVIEHKLDVIAAWTRSSTWVRKAAVAVVDCWRPAHRRRSPPVWTRTRVRPWPPSSPAEDRRNENTPR